jgi:haloacid dehalogenase superfamily, subfamily IA, variant 3 with third motif having DD or ED
MPKSKIKNIIFDLGNTLVYYDFWYFYDGVSRLEKKLQPAALCRFISEKKLGDKLCMGKILPRQAFRIIKKKFDLKTGYKDFIYLYADIFWENTYMKNFLEKLIKDNKFKVVLLSNTDIVHFNFINKNFPYVNLIRNKVLSYKTGMMKPSKKIFLHTLKKYKFVKSETLLIDDMKANIDAASSLGLHALHYKSHRQFLKKFNILTKK